MSILFETEEIEPPQGLETADTKFSSNQVWTINSEFLSLTIQNKEYNRR